MRMRKKDFSTQGSGGVRYFSLFVLSAWMYKCFSRKSCSKETFYFTVIYYQILLAAGNGFIIEFETPPPHSVFKTAQVEIFNSREAVLFTACSNFVFLVSHHVLCAKTVIFKLNVNHEKEILQ